MTNTLTPDQIVDMLNEYEETPADPCESNLWGDVIWGLPDYDEEGTSWVEHGSSDAFVAGGETYEHDHQRGCWVHAGPFDRAYFVNEKIEEILADLEFERPTVYFEDYVDQAATAALDPDGMGKVFVLTERLDHAVLRCGEDGWGRADEVYPAK